MNLNLELPVNPTPAMPLTLSPETILDRTDHPLKAWIAHHPGFAKLDIAASSDDLSRYQVYNWLSSAVERGEIVCIEGKYYAPAGMPDL